MSIVALSIVLIMLGGCTALIRWERPRVGRALVRVLIGGGCVIAAGAAIAVLLGVAFPSVAIPASVPGGHWTFGLDALSAAFVLAIATVGAACAGYGLPYLAGRASDGAVRRAHALVALLIATLLLVVIATAVVPFLIAWELLAITSYLLIIFEDERPTVRRAGLLYLVATHLSTLTLFALFALWGRDAHELTFAALAAAAPGLPAASSAAVLILALVAFGVKAGIVPLHIWLPEAHAAAPSHVSALMSGLVIKMGIYGLLRVVSLVAAPPVWWGWLVLTLGIISGVLGVVWALAQHDIKRLLAFHSVENIGIILMGIGAGALGLAYRVPAVAALGFAGAVLHTVNHALFKSLLFLGAGSVIHETGTRELDKLGGLAARMPVTATAFLVGAAAIVGLPPLNGFVSEWLVYRSLLVTGITTSAIRVAVLATGALALIGALALACFAKVVGVVFLGRAREPVAITLHEAPAGMLWPVIELAALCAAIGVLPIVVVPPALHVGELLAGALTPSIELARDADLVPFTTFTLALAGGLLVTCAIGVWRLGRERRPSVVETWGCGFASPTPRMQYTASSFAAPLIGAFRSVAGVETERSPSTFVTHVHDPVLEAVARPLWARVRAAGGWFRPLQRGQLARSLLYVVAAVLVALVYLVIAGGSA